MKKIIVIFFILFPFWLTADDNEIVTLFDNANKAYSENKYDEAIDNYLKIKELGYESAELYYNIGNAYFKNKKIAYSILFYEKAKILDPNNEKINHNLIFANQYVPDKIETVQGFFIDEFFFKIINSQNVDSWAYMSIFFFCAALVLLLIVFFNRVLLFRKIGLFMTTIFLAISITSYVFADKMQEQTTGENAAIIINTVTVKSSPDNMSTDLFILNQGVKVKLEDKLNDWYEIKLADGRIGWILKTNFEII